MGLVYINTYMYLYMQIQICICIYKYIFVYTNTYMYLYIQIHICICIYKYVFVYTYMYLRNMHVTNVCDKHAFFLARVWSPIKTQWAIKNCQKYKNIGSLAN